MAAAASSAPTFSWRHTMLRVRDLAASRKFYETHLGYRTVQVHRFDGETVAYLTTAPEGTKLPAPGSAEAEKFVGTCAGQGDDRPVLLAFTQRDGTDKDASFAGYPTGNKEPHRGFGHTANMVDDLDGFCDDLMKKGVAFQKKPSDGRMKTLAFILDTDGYWIELLTRTAKLAHPANFAQTMLRVKDPKRSLAFYRDALGMTLVAEKHFAEAKFSLFFLSHTTEADRRRALAAAGAKTDEEKKAWPKPDSELAFAGIKGLFNPILELTWNHGTESQDDFKYHGSAAEPRGAFASVGFVTEDVAAAQAFLEKKGVAFARKVGAAKKGSGEEGTAVAVDPDGYHVVLAPKQHQLPEKFWKKDE